MRDSYKMVFVNIIISLLFLSGLFLYRGIFKKKKIDLLILLIIISILSTLSIWRAGGYQSGDLLLHTYRSIDFFNAIKDGQIIPSWAEHLNGTYGYPVFVLNYSLQYFTVAVFHLFGLSFLDSMKLLYQLSFIASGIFMYLWTNEEFKNNVAAFFSSIFFLFSPYHIMDFSQRATAGELMAYAMIPLVLFLWKKSFDNKSIILTAVTGLSLAGSFLAHPASTIFFIGILVPYTIVLLKRSSDKKRVVIQLLASSIIGLLIASYSWVGTLSLVRFTHWSNGGQIWFQPFWEFIFTPYRFGFLFQGPRGELAITIGYTQLFVVLLSLFVLWKRKIPSKIKQQIVFWNILFFLLVFMLSPISKFVWNAFPVLNEAQFSYRLLLNISICTAVVAGIISLVYYKKYPIRMQLFIAITVLYTILNWGQRTMIPYINDAWLTKNLPYATYNYEGFANGSPKWTDTKNPWEKVVPAHHLEILSGNATIVQLKRDSIYHSYLVTARTQIELIENTDYFPGWNIFINNKKTNINYQNKAHPGVMTFYMNPGVYLIEATYTDIPILQIAKIVSIISFVSVVIFILSYVFIKSIHYGKVSLR